MSIYVVMDMVLCVCICCIYLEYKIKKKTLFFINTHIEKEPTKMYKTGQQHIINIYFPVSFLKENHA